jgi:hypothetical protein
MQRQNFSEVWSSTMTNHAHKTAPTQYVVANGIRFAYHRL